MRWIIALALGLVISLLIQESVGARSQVYSSRRRFVNRPGQSPFRISGRSNKPLLYGGKFGNGRRHGKGSSPLGRSSALRAGTEGSYDFKDQFNAILPDKVYVKPTKAPVPTTTTVNPHKINIESRIPAVTEPQTMVERATLGGTAIIHCYFDSSTQIGDFRHSQIWWTKQPQRSADRPIVLGAGTQVRLPDDRLKLVNYADDFFSILIIKNVLRSDAGEYKCSLPTISGTKTEFVNLQVYDPAAENIASSAEDNVVEVGGDQHLFCRPDNPRLNVWWTAKRQESGETIEIIRGKKKVAGRDLELKNLNRLDSGVYTCHVQVEVGSPIKRNFNVQVKEKPHPITAFKGGFNVDTFISKFSKDPEYGDEVNLRCDSGGIPAPSITWIKDNQALRDGGKYKIKTYAPTYDENAVVGSLTILNFSPADEGRYHCIASNDMGERQREFTVKGYYNAALGRTPAAIDDEDLDERSNVRQSVRGLAFGSRREGSDDEGSGEFGGLFSG